MKSKTLAELAAWDFAAQNPEGPELTVVNPIGIFGPVLGPDYGTSVGIIGILLDGKLPLIPRSSFSRADHRLHMQVRHITLPGPFVATLGEPKLISTANATNVLGWQPRPTADTLADTGESLLRLRAVSSSR